MNTQYPKDSSLPKVPRFGFIPALDQDGRPRLPRSGDPTEHFVTAPFNHRMSFGGSPELPLRLVQRLTEPLRV